MSETGPSVSVLRPRPEACFTGKPAIPRVLTILSLAANLLLCGRPMSQDNQDSPVQTDARRSFIIWACAGCWILAVVAGLCVLWGWENTPGAPGEAPSQWPAGSDLSRASDASTLILFAHPQCSCTRASLGEFAEILARATTPPRTFVVFLKPLGLGVDWEKTDLWRAAERLPGVNVVRDDEGHEATRFGVVTSGQTVLYDQSGALLFSGGITGARGHAGDNAGRASLVSLLNQGRTDLTATSVFGCPLFALLN